MSSKLLRNIYCHCFFEVGFSPTLVVLEFLWRLFWISKSKAKVLKTNIIDVGVDFALFFVKLYVCVRYKVTISSCPFMSAVVGTEISISDHFYMLCSEQSHSNRYRYFQASVS